MMTISRKFFLPSAMLLVLVIFSWAEPAAAQAKFPIEPVPASYLKDLPFAMPEIRLPEFAEKTVNVMDFHAVADGRTMNTEAFASAINACAASGGGMVTVPPGEYLTGPIVLKSNVNFHLERGAVIVFSKRFEDYPLVPFPSPTSKGLKCQPPIFAYKCDNIAITGGGVIDGSGEAWRPAKKEKYTESEWKSILSRGGVVTPDGRMWYPSKEAMNGEAYLNELKKAKKYPTAEELSGAREFLRPKMVELVGCTRVLLDGPTFRNSPSFAVHPTQCENLVVRNVTIQNPYSAQNGDGLDLSACHTAIVYKTTVDAGDDAICIKPGSFEESRGWDVSCENIIITDCTVYHGHGGFVIGSETNGGARNILARNLTLLGTDVGLRFKSAREKGSLVEKIYVDGVVMKDILDEAILFDTYYASGSAEKNALTRDDERKAERVTERTPQFSDFRISNVTCLGADRALLVLGLPEMPVRNITLSQSTITARKGALIVDAEGLTLDGVKIYPEASPVYTLNAAARVSITGGVLPPEARTFMSVVGKTSEKIVIQKSGLTDPGTQVTFGTGASREAVDVKQ